MHAFFRDLLYIEPSSFTYSEVYIGNRFCLDPASPQTLI